MGTAELQGRLWAARPRAWAELQEAANAPMYEAAFDAAGLRAGQRYLDIGCGAGRALSLAQRRGAKVSGLDAAAGLAELARARCPDADIRVGELEELPIADQTIDVVRGLRAPGPATLAIQTSGEGTVAEAIRQAIAPFRRADGSYNLRNAFRFIIAVKA